MQVALVFGKAVDAGADADVDGADKGRDAHALGKGVGVDQAGDAGKGQLDRGAAVGRPVEMAAQLAGAQVKAAAVVGDAAAIHAEGLAVDPDVEGGPVKGIGQLGIDDGHVVPEAVDERGGLIARIALFEAAAGAGGAAADREGALPLVETGGGKLGLGDRPGPGVEQLVKTHARQVGQHEVGDAHAFLGADADGHHAGRCGRR